jgi:hypothetical protein
MYNLAGMDSFAPEAAFHGNTLSWLTTAELLEINLFVKFLLECCQEA